MSVPWDFLPCPISSAKSRLRDFFRLLAIGMCHFLPVHHFGMAYLAGSKVKIEHYARTHLKKALCRVPPVGEPEDKYLCYIAEVVGTAQQVHCNRRRLLGRGLEFHVCTINKSSHTRKVWNLFNDPRTTNSTKKKVCPPQFWTNSHIPLTYHVHIYFKEKIVFISWIADEHCFFGKSYPLHFTFGLLCLFSGT